MGSPVTFGGFNNIDFNLILNAIMQQEEAPLRTLQTQQQKLQTQSTAFTTLATKLSTLETALQSLTSESAFGGRSVFSTDSTAVAITTTSSTAMGTYDIVVEELARSQVTATTSLYADPDSTIVANGGTLTIGGVGVTLTGDVTLQGLASAINTTQDIGVVASVVDTGSGGYQLVLMGTETGVDQAFTITNALTGGAGVTFADTDGDGISGDSAADNAVSAADARVVVNNITVTGSTNTIEGAIPGATLTLLRKDPATTVTATISRDHASTKTAVTAFVSAFNDLLSFTDQQADAARNGNVSIGRDPLLRGLHNDLRDALTAQYSVGGLYASLAEIGVEFEQTGELSFDETAFDGATGDHLADLMKLFQGGGGQDGVFGQVMTLVQRYTDAGGLLPDVQTRLDTQVQTLSSRISDLQTRLAIRKATLQSEFVATDLLISQLNSQVQSLGSLSDQYKLF